MGIKHHSSFEGGLGVIDLLMGVTRRLVRSRDTQTKPYSQARYCQIGPIVWLITSLLGEETVMSRQFGQFDSTYVPTSSGDRKVLRLLRRGG